MPLRRLLLLLAWFYIPVVEAVIDTGSPKPVAKAVSSADVLNWSVALLVVLAIFALGVWLLRKSGHFPVANVERMRVLTGLSLGMREKVVLLQVGKKQLILAVTPGRIETLHVLEGDDCLPTHPSPELGQTGNFAEKLKQVMKGG